MDYFIPIILGTGREGNNSRKVAEFVFKEAKSFGFDVLLIDPREYLDKPWTGGMSEEKRNKLSQIFQKANGFLIVSPEYNHGYPGELKLLLDEFYEEYNHKPVGICGVSVGKLGGGRMIEQLRLVLIEFQMIPLRNAVYFSNVENFDSEKENYKELLINLFSELKFYCQKMS
ncbi:MAG: NADPH-dependent FMN reductase [Patescibacteria group bacterium]